MMVMGCNAASAAATAVLPTPVGPTMTGTSGRSAAPKPSLQLGARQLYDGGPPMDVVRGQRGGQQSYHELAHLVGIEMMSRLDRGAARVRRGEALQPVGPAAEAAAREIGHELLEAARRFEARMRIGRRRDDHAAARQRLQLEAHAAQQLAVRVDRLQLGRCEVE